MAFVKTKLLRKSPTPMLRRQTIISSLRALSCDEAASGGISLPVADVVDEIA
jgi:hypothetical protein